MRSLDYSFAEDPYLCSEDVVWSVTKAWCKMSRFWESRHIFTYFDQFLSFLLQKQDSLRYIKFRFLSTWLNLPGWHLGASPEMKKGAVLVYIHVRWHRKETVRPPGDRLGDSEWRQSLLGGADRWSTFRSKREGRVNLVVQATTPNLLVSPRDKGDGGRGGRNRKKRLPQRCNLDLRSLRFCAV
jgi:hypothetical protein